MTGSGTQQDPYIVTTWEELTNGSTSADYYAWAGGDLDFNDIQPEGFTSQVAITGNVDFRNATFKNFYGRNASIKFQRSIENLNFLNAYFSGNSAFIFGGLAQSTVNNCKFSGIMETSSTAYIFHHRNQSTCKSCSFNIEANVDYDLSFGSKDIIFRDCLIITNVEQTGYNFLYVYGDSVAKGYLDNCKLEGKYLRKNGTYVRVGDGNSRTKNCFFNFESGVYQFNSNAGTSIYNSDKITVSSTTGTVGCTTAQLEDAAYLRSIGFPIGVD